ncbi:MAG TPA: GNAT family N-acetyltransferase [Eubacteriales bacterium]|nr:GNAT family N-acetyltransferase [Clostridia bacterium]HRV73801.1 GNAT family N-acetyltransferase [Eubacteriales bacterium]
MEKGIWLCPVTGELLHRYYRSFERDADIYMDMSLFTPYTYEPSKVDAYFERIEGALDRVNFMVMLSDAPIGELSLKHIDRDNSSCELSIHLMNDSVKGRGYGTRAERLVLEYAFNDMGMNFVLADVVQKNERSRHILEGLGFVQTGENELFRFYRIGRKRFFPTKA